MRLIEIIKQNIIAAVAVAMVVGFSAFKIADKSQNLDNEVWFTFDSELNPGDVGYDQDVLDPTKYTNTQNPGSPNCPGLDKVCAVRAEPDVNGNIPQQTLDDLESELMDPLSTHSDIERKAND